MQNGTAEAPDAKPRKYKRSGNSRKKRAVRPQIDYADLVRAFRDMNTLGEIAAHFGTTTTHVSQIACRLRKSGVKVRKLIGNQEIDVDYLNMIAEEQ